MNKFSKNTYRIGPGLGHSAVDLHGAGWRRVHQDGASAPLFHPLTGRTRRQPVKDNGIVSVVQIGDEDVARGIPHLDASHNHLHHAAVGEAIGLVQWVELAPVVEETGGRLGGLEALSRQGAGQAEGSHDNWKSNRLIIEFFHRIMVVLTERQATLVNTTEYS